MYKGWNLITCYNTEIIFNFLVLVVVSKYFAVSICRALLTAFIVVLLYIIIAACCGGITLSSCRSWLTTLMLMHQMSFLHVHRLSDHHVYLLVFWEQTSHCLHTSAVHWMTYFSFSRCPCISCYIFFYALSICIVNCAVHSGVISVQVLWDFQVLCYYSITMEM